MNDGPGSLHVMIRILDALAEYGPAQAAELAMRLAVHERIVRAWLRRLHEGALVCVLTHAPPRDGARGRGSRVWDLDERLGRPHYVNRAVSQRRAA